MTNTTLGSTTFKVRGLAWPKNLGGYTLMGPANHLGAWRWYEQQGPRLTERVRVSSLLQLLESRWTQQYSRSWVRIQHKPYDEVAELPDTHYAWELLDAEGDWQAGGSANSLEDVQREGNCYLRAYAQDGPHKLIIQQHFVTTIEKVTND